MDMNMEMEMDMDIDTDMDLNTLMDKENIVEALQFHSITQSHWSSGSTVCFPSRGFVSWGCTNSHWSRVSPVSAVSLQW